MSIGDASIHNQATPPTASRRRRWLRLGAVLTVLLLAIWMAAGGYEHLTAPHHRWRLPNGDTIEVLTFDNYYEGSYSLVGRGASATHYMRLRFRSSLHEPARDRADVRAASEIMCPIADSAGVHHLLIQPTRASFFDLLMVSRDYRFLVRSAADCDEVKAGT